MFINDTNNLIKKNKKIILNLNKNESILKNKFWMNVYDKMKLIIDNYKNNITYKKNLHDGSSILTHVFKDSAFISPIIIDYIKSHLTHYYLIELTAYLVLIMQKGRVLMHLMKILHYECRQFL